VNTYLIKKIFGPTIQGEGSRAGTPVKFIRFAGCNKWSGKPEHKSKSICWYCDTDFHGGEKLMIPEIISKLDALGPVKQVVLSGGEPTLQIDEPLLVALAHAGYTLHLETNGSKDIDTLAGYFTHITMSPKQGLDETRLRWAHDIKLLFPWIKPEISAEAFKTFSADNRFIQTLWTDEYRGNLDRAIEWLMLNPQYRLSVQTHKIINVE
jgi:organic radical activating enzyme